jgi:hypothetical protein
MTTEYGRLDRERRTWTDSTGHVTDLTLTWQDVTGRRWSWDADTDPHPINGPWMCSNNGLHEPMDMLLAMWAPLTPVVAHAERGGAAWPG